MTVILNMLSALMEDMICIYVDSQLAFTMHLYRHILREAKHSQ